MNRRRLLVVGALALLGLAGVLLAWLTPRPGAGITQENSERIREGMTEQEVEAVLGCPAGNYRGPESVLQERGIPLWVSVDGDCEDGPQLKLWVGPRFAVHVLVDCRGRVVQSSGHEVEPLSLWEVLAERVRRLLSR